MNTIATVDQLLADLRTAAAAAAFAPGNDAAKDQNLADALAACMDGLTAHGIAYDAAYTMTEEALELAYLAAKANAKEEEDELVTGDIELVPCIHCGEPGIDGLPCLNPDCACAAIPAAAPAPSSRSLLGRVALGIAGALTLALGLGSVALATIPAAPADNFGIPYTAAQANAMAWAERGSFGPILHAGADAAVLIGGELTQIEYIPCRYEAGALWHEDGSASHCESIAAWQEARNAHIAGLMR